MFYSFSGCSADPNTLNTTVYVTANNTLYADQGVVFTQGCKQQLTFAQWQALGQDTGSTTDVTPDVPTLIAIGADLLL